MKHLLLVAALLGPVEHVDLVVRARIQAARHPVLESPMRTATKLGQRDLVLGTLLGIAVFGGPPGLATVRNVVFAAIPTNVIVEIMKPAVNRARPDGEHRRSNASFPSSHAANSFALAGVFARRWRRWALGFWALASVVAFSRMYLDRHYLSDVVVGALIGLLCAWLAADWSARRAARATHSASRSHS